MNKMEETIDTSLRKAVEYARRRQKLVIGEYTRTIKSGNRVRRVSGTTPTLIGPVEMDALKRTREQFYDEGRRLIREASTNGPCRITPELDAWARESFRRYVPRICSLDKNGNFVYDCISPMLFFISQYDTMGGQG